VLYLINFEYIKAVTVHFPLPPATASCNDFQIPLSQNFTHHIYTLRNKTQSYKTLGSGFKNWVS